MSRKFLGFDDLQSAALLVDQPLEPLMRRPVDLYRRLTGDSQLRWVGPEKGVIHLAAAAVINAVWDLWARYRGLPLWRLVCGMSPEEVVACVDFRHLTDALTPGEALELLRARVAGREERIERLLDAGYPSYTTSAGWLGYSDEALREKCRDLKAHYEHIRKGTIPADARRQMAHELWITGATKHHYVSFNPSFERKLQYAHVELTRAELDVEIGRAHV